jgi:hypothetical protein
MLRTNAKPVNGKGESLVNVTGNEGTLQNHTGLSNLLKSADEVGGCDRSSSWLYPTTESELYGIS